MNENLKWIAKGSTGCVFATLFAKNPKAVGWQMLPYGMWKEVRAKELKDVLIYSITFPKVFTIGLVRKWALENGFYEEETSYNTIGLRIDCKEGKSWVQYFGPDSHVKTRQSPVPMLMYTEKLGVSHYAKVGFKGILHLAHAWSKDVKESIYDKLWHRSYKQTEKILGKRPGIEEAAKTTFKL